MAKHEIDFEGQKFELQTGPLNELVLSEFFAAMSGAGDEEIPHDVMLSLLEASIEPKDFRRFKKLGRQTPDFWNKAVKVFEARMRGPVEEESGHPTGQPSDSTDGPQTTPPKSESAFDAKVWDISGGRIDHYHMLMEAKKHQHARSA